MGQSLKTLYWLKKNKYMEYWNHLPGFSGSTSPFLTAFHSCPNHNDFTKYKDSRKLQRLWFVVAIANVYTIVHLPTVAYKSIELFTTIV